jgi:Tol biopolymer transport system component
MLHCFDSWWGIWFVHIFLFASGWQPMQEIPVSAGRWDRHASGGSYFGTQPSFSPDATSVVYSSPATGHGDIYRFDRIAGRNVRLTLDPEYDGCPVYSPDGRIVFIREKNRVGHLWVIDADGSGQTQLTKAPADDNCAAFSKDGKFIVFCRVQGGISHVWIMDKNGGNQKQLTDGPWFDGLPSLSADGTQIVFSRMEEEVPHLSPDPGASTLRMPEIFLMRADGSNVRRLTYNRGYESPLSFSPDGKFIFFNREDGYGAVNKFSGVCLMNADGSDRRDICKGDGSIISPDCRRIVISERNPRGLVVLNSDGTARRSVHNCKLTHDELAFSRDGSQVVFVELAGAQGDGRIVILDLNTSKAQAVPQIE